MADRINTHEFVEGVCVHCKSAEGARAGCDWRDAPPRAVPASVFADLPSIGARLAEIRAAEGRG